MTEPPTQFCDEIPANANIRAVRIRCGARIDGIALEYLENGIEKVSQWRGGSGGRNELFYLDPGDYIIGVYIWYEVPNHSRSTTIAVQFKTDKGRLSSRFGGIGGYMEYTIANGGKRFVGIAGVAMQFVDLQQVFWRETASLEAPSDSITIAPKMGGDSGISFCDLRELGSLENLAVSKIHVRSSEDCIYGIQVTYDAEGRECTYHGGSAGTSNSFYLSQGEYIIAVEGRAGDIVYRLQFVTNLGRKSNIFGGNGGHPFRWEALDKYHALLFFNGRSGTRLDQLQGNFYPIPKPAPSYSDEQEPVDTSAFVQNASPTLSWSIPVQMTMTFTVNPSELSDIPRGRGVVITGTTVRSSPWQTNVQVKCPDGTIKTLPVNIQAMSTTTIPEHILVLVPSSN